MRLYDAHNHLQDARLSSVEAEALRDCRELGLVKMVVNGTEEEDWARVLRLASETREVIPCVGLHPWFVQKRSADWEKRLVECLDAGRCGIGEVGLDRWIEGYDPAEQEEVFVVQLRVAAARNLPVSIHCLKAWGPLLEILGREQRPACGFLLHSYGGSAELIKPLAELGAYFSCSGYFAHERRSKQRAVFQEVPLDRLLIETDAPDMLPPDALIQKPFTDSEGKPANHPANIQRIYAFVAELRGLPVENFAERIEQNFQRLFGGLV
jgi:TatD DNase family protein